MVDEGLLTRFRVENFMAQHHLRTAVQKFATEVAG
jgi:hypothetical protein